MSDGEHQLLAVFAIIDLFDNDTSLLLLDEVDSHLYYKNIQKLWEIFNYLEGKAITTTHSVDSIVLNNFEDILLVEKGILNKDNTANVLIDRVNVLSSNNYYKFQIASKLGHIALVEDYFDWFVFRKLSEKLIPDFNPKIFEKIQFIKCSSGFENYTERFGNSKIDWVTRFSDVNKKKSNTKNIFMICDRDKLALADLSGCKVNSAKTRPNNFKLPENGNAYLLSWNRREIENYILSYSVLKKHGILTEINGNFGVQHRIKKGNTNDNEQVMTFDSKKLIQRLYLKDGQKIDSTNESWVDYDKLGELIDLIPTSEISPNIAEMYNFLKSKVI